MPTPSELDAALLQPAMLPPVVQRLGGGRVRRDDHGQPLRTVGPHAVVYELRTPTGRILALRCHLTLNAGRDALLARRYAALHADPRLSILRSAGGCLPRDIHWVPGGVILEQPGQQPLPIPVMTMERVPGRSILRTVDRLCHSGETGPLGMLADRWLDAALAMEEAGFVHGDLAADNLIVRPDGSIALVDLDSALWPGSPPPSPDNAGSPGYVHPRGMPRDPLMADRFPALVLWTSLRLLERHPDLRERWGDHPDAQGAALLFSSADLRSPEESPLFAHLAQTASAETGPLLEVLRRAIRFSPDETPPLSEIAIRLDDLGFPSLVSHAPLSRPAAASAALAPPLNTLPDVQPSVAIAPQAAAPVQVAPVRDLAPPPASPPARDPAQGHLVVQHLSEALAARDPARIAQHWSAAREVDAAAVFAPVLHQMATQEANAAVERAVRKRDDAGLIAAMSAAEEAGVAPSAAARTAARTARNRLGVRRELAEALAANDYVAIAALQRSGKLTVLGSLEPHQARAVARSLAWPGVERALASDDDTAICASADPALWREEGTLPADAWQRLDLARSRLRWVEDVRAALRRRDGPVLRGLLAGSPSGAEEHLTEVESRRVIRVITRESAATRLERALRDGSDREVVTALAELEATGAPFSEFLDWAAVRGVVDRLSLAEEIRAALASDPPDAARLARLLPAVRASMRNQDEAMPEWVEMERAVLQAAHLSRLREALATGVDAAIVSAADPDPYGVRGLLTANEREQVAGAISRERARYRSRSA